MADVRLERISTSDRVACDAVVQVMRDSYFPYESYCRGCDLISSPAAVEQLSLLVRVVLQDGASVGLYCGDQLVAVSVNKVQVPDPEGEQPFFERFRDEHAHDPRATTFMNFMLQIEAKLGYFEALGAGGERRTLELMFVGVLPSYRGRGFGLQVMRESIGLARELGFSAVSAIFSSDYSLSIGRKLGFKDVVAVLEHSEFIFEGKPMSKRLGPAQQRSYFVLFELDT